MVRGVQIAAWSVISTVTAKSVRVVSHGAALCCIALSSFAVNAGVNSFTASGPEGGLVRKVVFHPTDSSVVYLIANSGFYRSSDAGASWKLVSSDFNSAPTDLAVSSLYPSRAALSVAGEGYESVDDGMSLRKITALPNPWSSAVDYGSDGWLYAVSVNHVGRSSDGGATWQSAADLPGAATVGFIVRAHPVTPGLLYVVTFDGHVYRSVDHGDHWTSWNLPVLGTPGNLNGLAIAPTTGEQAWLTSSNGLWRRESDGTWVMLGVTGEVNTIAMVDAQTVYVNQGSTGLLRTIDGGSQWQNIQPPLNVGMIFSVAQSAANPHRVLAGGLGGVAISDDDGLHWRLSNAGINASDIADLIPVAKSGRVYISNETGIHVDQGDGAGFSALNNSALHQLGHYDLDWRASGLSAFAGTSDRLATSLAGGGIARSADGGQSWATVPNLSYAVQQTALAGTDGGVLLALAWVGSDLSLLRTQDNGTNWQQVSNIVPFWISDSLQVAQSNPNIVYLLGMTTSNGQRRLFRSEDAGEHWVATAPIDCATFTIDPKDGQKLYAGTPAGLMRSVDGGASWTNLAPMGGGGISLVAVDPQDPQILFAAGQHPILRSVDSGATWQYLPVPMDPALWFMRAITVHPRQKDRLLVSLQGRGIHEITIEPDLAIASGTQGTISPGQSATLEFTMTNLGTFDATDVVASITLSAAASNVAGTLPGGSCVQVAAGLECSQRVLRAGTQNKVTVTFLAPAQGDIEASATIAGAQIDPVSTNNSAQLTAKVAVPTSSESPTPTPAPTPSSNPSGSGGGGGGGSFSMLFLALIGMLRARGLTRRFRNFDFA
jgi:photosystem II stability/assembly factor-like uncharacterized protein